MAVSLVRNPDDDTYTALLRTVDYNERKEVPSSEVKVGFFRSIFGLGPTPASYIRAVSPTLPASRFKRVNQPEVPQEFLSFEEKQTIKGFKFGVLYCGAGQVREDELFANGEFVCGVPSPFGSHRICYYL